MAKRIFLDANVLVAMGISPTGDYAQMLGWKGLHFVTSEHILFEVAENLADIGVDPASFIDRLRQIIEVTDRVMKLPTGLALADDEDRQALAEAIGSECDEFVTFNSRDFSALYGTSVYGVLVRHSGEFVRHYAPH